MFEPFPLLPVRCLIN